MTRNYKECKYPKCRKKAITNEQAISKYCKEHNEDSMFCPRVLIFKK